MGFLNCVTLLMEIVNLLSDLNVKLLHTHFDHKSRVLELLKIVNSEFRG